MLRHDDHPARFKLGKTLERIMEAHPNACIVGLTLVWGNELSFDGIKRRYLEPGSGMGKVLLLHR